ncbi:MAG: histidine kinase [Pseudonocardia sp.]
MKVRSASDAMPDLVEPMQAGSGELPTGSDWAVEFAWEGLRTIAYVRPNRVRLLTATGRTVTASFPDLEAPLSTAAPRNGFVLDGTIVALNESGFPRRRALQSRSGNLRPSDALVRRVPVGYLVSDVLWFDGHSTVGLPYQQRRNLRDELDLDRFRAWSSPSFPVAELGPVMVAAEQHGVDALHAKHLDAPYRPGKRSRYWLRLPVRPVRQVVIGGWSPADPRRPESIGAVLLGVPDGGGADPPTLRYVGRAGLRSAEDRHDVACVLPALHRPHSPFAAPLPATIARHARWVESRLIGRVQFADWTPDGRMRLPTWRGLVPVDQRDAAQFAVPPPAPLLAPPPAPAERTALSSTPSGRKSRSSETQPPDPATPTGRPAAAVTQPADTEARRLEQHFVYNSLNTIASVIRTDPARARELLLGFADLTRAADQPDDASTTLGKELAVVRAYVQLQQARFGKRLRVEIDVDAGLDHLPVRVMQLLSVVRHAVQHGIEPLPGGGLLAIRSHRTDEGGELTVTAAAGEPIVIRFPTSGAALPG